MTALFHRDRIRPWSRTLFQNPGSAYRGAPFWSWNCRLDRDQLFRQLRHLKTMGFGGAYFHARVGLDTPYLGEEFLQLVRDCEAESRRLGLFSWLYDEDRWPSGSAGGLVTRDKRFRARHLVLTSETLAAPARLLWRYEVALEQDGALRHYRRLGRNEMAGRGMRLWQAYLRTDEPSGWHNGATYVDTLNPKAIARFLKLTHERYRQAVGRHFGKSVPAIFTDEPQFTHKVPLTAAASLGEVVLPFTDDFPRSYARRFGGRFEDTLPEVVWEIAEGEASLARYRYHEHIAELFATALAGTLSDWCRRNGLGLTGHMMAEATLDSQTRSLGEVMRSLGRFDVPGIDILCDLMEWNTAKQAQSAARQNGAEGVLSELYGVTGWDFDFPGHKRQGDWQAALGVTFRVPHLAWVSMGGEAKRDYPAAIGWQSPWFERYRLVEDHFARINVAMSRGRALVRVAVIHPVESFWLCFGPEQQTRGERREREDRFEQLTRWLLFGTLDFDFLCESLLPSHSPRVEEGCLRIGEMSYEVVIVPALRTIRATTLAVLEKFAEAGGRIIFAGEVPGLVDAVPSERATALAAQGETCEFASGAILRTLEAVRDLEVWGGPAGSWRERPGRSDVFVHQIRQDGENRFLFVCNTDRERGRAGTRLRLRGVWKVTLCDTQSGREQPVTSSVEAGWTEWLWDAPAHGSLLVRLEPGRRARGITLCEPEWAELGRLGAPKAVTLSEPNVLLLDQAEWRLGGERSWRPSEEILRIDRQVRTRLGLPLRGGKMKQPWADRSPVKTLGVLELRFLIESELEVASPRLALEDAEHCQVLWNGEDVPTKRAGYFVDEAIPTLDLPPVRAGSNELRLSIPMTRKRAVEWGYLLGDFGVSLRGRRSGLVAPVRRLEWGDWTHQGLPFYAGNVTYQVDGVTLRKKGGAVLEVFHFSAPVIEAREAGRLLDPLAFAPHRASLQGKGGLLELTAFGNRFNAFGPLHNTNFSLVWAGPDSWRSEGSEWTYEYRLKPMGILSAPLVRRPG